LRINATDITIVEIDDPLSTIDVDEDPWAGSRGSGAGFATIGIWAQAELGRLRRSRSDTQDAFSIETGRAFFEKP
jgi:hypothetical protein